MARPIAERLIGGEAYAGLDLDYLTDHITDFTLAALGADRRALADIGRRPGGGLEMCWIALKMLVGDKAKFFGIVMGLTFAALLINQQGSIFCGLMCRTAGQIYDITGADLWVMDPNVRYIDDVKPMLENNLYRVRGVEGVEWAVPLYKGNARREAQLRSGADGQAARGHRAGDPARPGRRLAGRGPAAGADPRRRPDRPAQARRGDRRLHPPDQALPGRGLEGPRRNGAARRSESVELAGRPGVGSLGARRSADAPARRPRSAAPGRAASSTGGSSAASWR